MNTERLRKTERIIKRLDEDGAVLMQALSDIETAKGLVRLGDYDRAGQLIFAARQRVRTVAKLSARGRTELLRLERYENEADPLSDTGEIRPLVRRELALMSDRAVLSKATFTRPDGSTHSTGWSVLGKLKDGETVETFREAYTTREPKYTVKNRG